MNLLSGLPVKLSDINSRDRLLTNIWHIPSLSLTCWCETVTSCKEHLCPEAASSYLTLYVAHIMLTLPTLPVPIFLLSLLRPPVYYHFLSLWPLCSSFPLGTLNFCLSSTFLIHSIPLTCSVLFSSSLSTYLQRRQVRTQNGVVRPFLWYSKQSENITISCSLYKIWCGFILLPLPP